jgi:hypothetical protein
MFPVKRAGYSKGLTYRGWITLSKLIDSVDIGTMRSPRAKGSWKNNSWIFLCPNMPIMSVVNTLACQNLIHPKIKSAKQNLVPTSLGLLTTCRTPF